MERIAIIGIGCRFPGGGNDPENFWSLLQQGRCSIGEIPSERWSLEGFFDPRPDVPNRSYSKWGGFLDDIGGFDPAYFHLSPREAEAMDPQQRLLLMVAREAVFDARLPLEDLRRSQTGVFIGVSNIDYGLLQRYRSRYGERHAGTGTALSIVANRISNRLDLPGPSMGVDTACSSSLVAVDTACRHLADGSCDMALAGGVNILLDPRMFITFSRAHMLSPTGRIRAFDAAADGFVRGEGVGVVLLRRLQSALDAGDRIYAVIDATAVNQDGRTGSITEPSLEAQIAMMRSVAERAGLPEAGVDYVEAHGTGTFVGDPIEANAIGTVFGRRNGHAPLPVGSVKTNIGHLEPAAGIAGLIKTALILHHKHVPVSVGYEQPNPAIDFDGLGISVASRPQDFGDEGRPLRALVNSFGFGGTNACALLSRFEGQPEDGTASVSAHAGIEVAAAAQDAKCKCAVPLSAPTQRHLQHFAASLAEAISDGPLAGRSVSEIAGALCAQCDHDEHRAAIIAATPEELCERLSCLAEGRDWPAADRQAPPEIITGKAKAQRTLVFTMTGQGGQWWSMGRELIEREAVFRTTIESFDSVFKEIGGWSVMDVLLATEEDSNIHDAAITPAVMFAFQTGLAEVWRRRGVRPDIVLGHSFGEVTAAYLAGGIDQAAVGGLVTHRGLIRSQVDRVGTMAAIGLGAEAITPLLPDDGSIEIGGYNSPQMVTLTGEEQAIDALIRRLNDEDETILTRKLALDFAYHSSWFEPVEHIFKADVGELDTAPPKLPVISTVTGELNERFDADYWWRNLRYPVRYQQAVEKALELGGDTFVELGPHRTLSSMTAACAAAKGQSATTVSTLDKRWGDLLSITVATAQLYVSGIDVDWSVVYEPGSRSVTLPRQPWIVSALWSQPEEASRSMHPPQSHPLLGPRESGPTPVWSGEVSLATHAYLGDHRLQGECVFPAAAYVDMLTAAAQEVLDCKDIELVDVTFPAALYIGADDTVLLRTTYEASRRRLAIYSRLRDGSDDWQLRSQARAYPLQAAETGAPIEPPSPETTKDAAAFYRAAEANGFGWGPEFQGLQSIASGDQTAWGTIAVRSGAHVPLSASGLDPRIIDSALQLMLACNEDTIERNLVPVGVARVRVVDSLGHDCFAAASTRVEGGDAVATVTVAGSENTPAVRFEGVRLRSHHRTRRSDHTGAVVLQFYSEYFEGIDIDAGERLQEGTWLFFAHDGCARTEAIADAFKERGGQVEIRAVAGDSANDTRLYQEAFHDCFARSAVAGIVYALPLSLASDGPIDIADAARNQVIRATAFGQAIAELASDEPLPRITILTQGARSVDKEEAIPAAGLAQSALFGLFRTIVMEAPEVSLQLVDLDHGGFENAQRLIDVLAADGRETELALRSGRVFAQRFGEIPENTLRNSSAPASQLGDSRNYALRHQGAPGADGLRWRQVKRDELGPDDVEVEVRAVGLNFRDVLAISGLLPVDAEPGPAIEALGLELSGVVVARGANVRVLDVGDHVLGMGRGAFQRHVIWPCGAVQQAPPGLSHVEAATIPSAFLTAHYALNHIGRLQPGMSVLIHSATGGVGLAAVALARRAGARIFATAGTHDKREYLRGLGIEHVFDSRSLGFADDVMLASGGRGVDVVLNSLGGDYIDKSLACVAPYGRFLELGKRDVYADGVLGLRSLRSNVSFHVIDVAALIADRPAFASDLLGEVLALLAAREIEPLPVSLYRSSQIGDAVRQMAEARHIGKVVVELDEPELQIESAIGDGAPFDTDGTYLVTGGVDGFGRCVGEWLAARGAGRVVLASRSAATTEPAAAGDTIQTCRLDVTDSESVADTVRSLTGSDKPLRGIIHAAVVYDDALIANMTEDRISRVLAPKIDGGLNLTRAVETCGAQLDFFVSFSSLAQVVGWAGQSNYAAANSFVNALAAWQQARGIPGRCINWGALDESGHVARSQKMQSYLSSAGWIGIDNETALASLARVLDSDETALAVPSVDWKRLAATHPVLGKSARTAGLVSAGTGGSDQLSSGLMALTGEELSVAVAQLVRNEAAKVLRVSADDLALAETLGEAGIDSLSAFELRLRIEQQLRLEVPLARYARASRFDDLAALSRALVEEERARQA